jgi:predicted nucleic acid-binding protein
MADLHDFLNRANEMEQRAAELRATHGLRTPDAIQLATAMDAGAAALLTNDTRLRTVAGLEVLILAELRGA